MTDSSAGEAGGAAIMGTGGAAKSMVFINDVAFEVAAGPFNVRAAFGDDAVLIHSSGHPVFTNEWGVTLQSLHHGAFYYLVCVHLNLTYPFLLFFFFDLCVN